MGYFTRTLEQINKRFAQRLPQVTSITYVGEGGLARGLLRILAEEIGDLYGILDYNSAQVLVTTAKGPALDSLGYIFNVTRRDVLNPASQDAFYFYLNTNPNHTPGYANYSATGTITIPQNTIVSTHVGYIGELLSFKTSASVSFTAGQSIKYATLIPLNSMYQTDIGKHQITNHEYAGTSSGYVYCTNPKTITVARNRETDDQYRERILAAVPFASSSNEIAVRIAALNADHVRDVSLVERPYGPGTARVIIDVDDVVYESSALTQATSNVNEKRPFGSRVTIELAEKIPVDVTYTTALEIGANSVIIDTMVNQTLTNYINSLGIGDTFHISRLIDSGMDVSTDIIDLILDRVVIGGSSLSTTSFTPKPFQVLVPGTVESTSFSEAVY